MSEFNFKSAVCTSRSQSERLLALGLKKETADMVWRYSNTVKGKDCYDLEAQPYDFPEQKSRWIESCEKADYLSHWFKPDGTPMTAEEVYEAVWGKDIPAWSLHRLIEMMPKCVRAHSSEDDSPRLHPYVPRFDYMGVTIENIDEILDEFYQHTDLYDNLIDCIEWLIDDNRFNKKYLV